MGWIEPDGRAWWMIGWPPLSLKDRLRLLFGATLCVRFDSPDGQCHAACAISARVVDDVGAEE